MPSYPPEMVKKPGSKLVSGSYSLANFKSSPIRVTNVTDGTVTTYFGIDPASLMPSE